MVQQYERRLNDVLDFIQAHSAEPLPLERLAGIAGFSPFHFHRLFKAYTGEPPHTFVRRIRLEKALGQMGKRARPPLSEIALGVGFASPSDFSRAFREVYGYPPSAHRPGRLAEESKIRQGLLQNQGYGFRGPNEAVEEDEFQVRVEDHPARRIAYLRVVGAYQPERMMAALNRLLDWGRTRNLWPSGRLAAISPDNPDFTPTAQYRLDLCLVVPERMPEDEEMSFGEIPAGRYGAVHCRGDIHKVDRAWTHLYERWLPWSGFEPADAPNVELFRSNDGSEDWNVLDLDCMVPLRPLLPR